MNDKIFMQRCFDLARLGAGTTSPNPMVGAVLVHDGLVIGEGWHQAYGKAHAEVNCIASVREADRALIEKSTLYVSLEPCCFHGKTPACTDLILRERIPKVVVASLDETPEVAGKGVEILRKAGVEVVTGFCADQSRLPSEVRNVFVSLKRPFIQLKFAKSADGFFGTPEKQVWLSNQFSQILAHKGRGEFDAILVGTNTALTDDPTLNNRYWFGKSPIRIVFDKQRRLPGFLKLFNGPQQTWVVTEKKLPNDRECEHLKFLELEFDDFLLDKLINHLFMEKISSLIVEGGAFTLQQFLKKNLWDEAAIFSAPILLGDGILAPTPAGPMVSTHHLGTDTLTIVRNGKVGR